MQPERMIFDDMPAFIPVPAALQHRRAEVIVWPLEADDKIAAKPDAPLPQSGVMARQISDPIRSTDPVPPPQWDEFFQRFTHTSDADARYNREDIYAEHLR